MDFFSYLLSFPVYCLIPVRIYVPRRQTRFAFEWVAREDDHLFVSDLCPCFHRLEGHPFGTLSVSFPLKTLSSQGRLCFPLDSW